MFLKYVLRLLWNEDQYSCDFNVVGSSFQMLDAAKEHVCYSPDPVVLTYF